MNEPKFQTYWTIDGQRIENLSAVERLVEAGAIATENSADQQRASHERQVLLDKWHRQAVERYDKIVAQQQHKNSPEGQRQIAVRHAAEHPGGIVTTTGRHSVFDELDAFSPGQTDVFK